MQGGLKSLISAKRHAFRSRCKRVGGGGLGRVEEFTIASRFVRRSENHERGKKKGGGKIAARLFS